MSGPRDGSGGGWRSLRTVVYNPLTLAAPLRLNDISMEYKSVDFIFLQGTTVRSRGEPSRQVTAEHLVVRSGYGRNSNHARGVAVALHRH
eukprot:3987549-Pyramimonas_sp.AAC.1